MTTKRAPPPVYFIDYEAEDWDKVLCASLIDHHGNASFFTGPGATLDVQSVLDRTGGTLWAHAGGIYDHPLYWRDTELPEEVILTGSAVLKGRATPKRGRPGIVFRDSLPRTSCGLDKIGKAIGLPKLDVDRGHAERLTTRELREYCERDTEILRRGTLGLDGFLADHGVKANTSGGAAVKMLAALDPDTWLACTDHLVLPSVASGIIPTKRADGTLTNGKVGALAAVRGGRCETRHIGEVTGPVYVYDLHSSYPSQYGRDYGSGADVPVGCVADTSTNLNAWGWVDWVSWDSNPTGTAFELDAENRGKGKLEGWLTWEIAQALATRGANPRRQGKGWKGTGRVSGFAARFVDTLYRLKEGGGFVSFACKVTVNSLHGKFSEDPIHFRHMLKPENRHRPLSGLDDASWQSLYDEVPAFVKAEPHMQPVAGATILGRARLALALGIEATEKAGGRFFYCDTDSIHCNLDPVRFDAAQCAQGLPGIGPDLGQWGHEATARRAIYVAPKVYRLETEKGDKGASKGFPKDKVNMDLLVSALAARDGVSVHRGGIGKFKSGGAMGKALTLTRTMRAVHTNRRLLSTGALEYLMEGEKP